MISNCKGPYGQMIQDVVQNVRKPVRNIDKSNKNEVFGQSLNQKNLAKLFK